MASGLQILPIAIGSYADPGYPELAADAEVEQVVAVLAGFHPQVLPWDQPPAARGLDAINARLLAWSGQPDGGDTILYWVGHGWSNDVDAALATRYSPANEAAAAVMPEGLATHLSRRAGTAGWVFAIFDACRSTRFVELLAAQLLHDPHGARQVVLLGVSGDGVTRLGRFRAALKRSLDNTFQGITDIDIQDLVRDLAADLGGAQIGIRVDRARLTIQTPVTAPSTPLDVAAELRDLLDSLPPDERRHFIPKGQGAEQGELAWYFQGREQEQCQISDWLRGQDTGMLVVTGRPGCGKSALLGQVLTQSRPQLRQTLARHNLLPQAPVEQRPDDDTFDHTLLLTGFTPTDVVTALATGIGLGQPPAGASLAVQTDWLVDRTRAAARPLTLLVDALDEAEQPLTSADRLLRRLSTIPGVRVVVGTRRSTHEGPDLPEPPDTNLLDALGSQHNQIIVHRAPQAIARYVRRRLTSARPDIDPDLIGDLAVDIAAREGNEFLFARLAAHEIIADPTLLTTGAARLQRLLSGDHRSLFAAALTRLAAQAPASLALLRALAFARGRGAPILDNIWATIAAALTPDHTATREQIDTLLKAAAPYLMFDLEDGQAVYRLAHRTFQEHLLAQLDEQDLTSRHHNVLTALLELVGDPGPFNPYLTRHLSGHAAAAGMPGWHTLAGHPDALDLLDQTALGADAMRSAFGHTNKPPEIAGVIAARHHLATAAPETRHGIRQLATARHIAARALPRQPPIHTRPAWSIRSAHLRQHPFHAILTDHTGTVTTVAAFVGPDRRTLLASGSTDETVRLWDPTTGTPIGLPLTGHTGQVLAVAPFAGQNGRTLLATGSMDGNVRVWNPYTGNPVGDPLTGHTGPMFAVAPFAGQNGRTLLVTGGADETVRVWDPTTGTPVSEPLTGHTDWVTAVATFAGPDGRTLLATGSRDRTVRLWDPTTGSPVGEPLTGHTGAVLTVAAFTGPDGRTLLATGSRDRTVRLWDPTTGTPVSEPLTGHTDRVTAVATFAGPDGRTLLATGSWDQTVRMWDPTTGSPVGDPLTGHTAEVTAVAAFVRPDGRTLLATGSRDRTVRLWDPTTGTPFGDPPTGHTLPVYAVVAFTTPDGRPLLASGSDDETVRVWDPATGTPIGDPLTGHTDEVAAVATFVAPDGQALLATGSRDHTVRVWDPTTGTPIGDPLRGHTNWVTAVVAFAGPDGQALLATGGLDCTVRVWDPATGTPIGDPLRGHTLPVYAVATFTTPDGRTLLASGSRDRTVRLWDPTTGTPVGDPLRGHTDQVTAVATFTTPDGRTLLASGSRDRTVRLWDPTTGTPVGDPLRGHTDEVTAVTALIGPDGRPLLATGSRDQTVRVWDAVTKHHEYTIPIDSDVAALASVDGGVAVGCRDGLVVIDLSSEHPDIPPSPGQLMPNLEPGPG